MQSSALPTSAKDAEDASWAELLDPADYKNSAGPRNLAV